MIRRPAIDDHIRNSALCREQGERRCRVDRQGRAKRNDQVCAHCRGVRFFQYLWVQALPEADRGRFQESAAFTTGRLAMEAKEFEVGLRIGAHVTAYAFHQQICAVQFDQPLGARSGQRVQAVNVLRYDHQDPAGLFQGNDRAMDCIRLRGAKTIPAFELVVPVFDPRRF